MIIPPLNYKLPEFAINCPYYRNRTYIVLSKHSLPIFFFGSTCPLCFHFEIFAFSPKGYNHAVPNMHPHKKGKKKYQHYSQKNPHFHSCLPRCHLCKFYFISSLSLAHITATSALVALPSGLTLPSEPLMMPSPTIEAMAERAYSDISALSEKLSKAE